MLIDNDKPYNVLQNSRSLFPCYSNRSPKEGYGLKVLMDTVVALALLMCIMSASTILLGNPNPLAIIFPQTLPPFVPTLVAIILIMYIFYLRNRNGEVAAISLDKENLYLITYGITTQGISEIRDISIPVEKIISIKLDYNTDKFGKIIYKNVDESFPKNSLLANMRMKIAIYTKAITYSLYAQRKSPAYKVLSDLSKDIAHR